MVVSFKVSCAFWVVGSKVGCVAVQGKEVTNNEVWEVGEGHLPKQGWRRGRGRGVVHVMVAEGVGVGQVWGRGVVHVMVAEGVQWGWWKGRMAFLFYFF
ncbi:unnamed protein product [Amaranthus hypochondriacus]